MAGSFWADGASAAKTAPDSSQLEVGLLEGKPIVVTWLNWLLNKLHEAYVTATYYISVIKIGKSTGSPNTLTIKTNDGATTLLTIEDDSIRSEVPLELDGTSGKVRIEMFDGPRVKFSGSGGSNLRYAGYTEESSSIPSAIQVWSLTGNSSPKREYYLILDLNFPYNTSDDAESATLLYKDPRIYANVETSTPGSSSDNTLILQFGYNDLATGDETIVSSSSSSMSTVATVSGNSVVVVGSTSGVLTHDFNTKERAYWLRLKFEMGTSDLISVRNMYIDLRSYSGRWV